MNVKIIKNNTQTDYRRTTLKSSLIYICNSLSTYEDFSEKIASEVCNNVETWLKDKSHVTSQDIKRIASNYLKQYHTDAAMMYEAYDDII